MKTTILITLLLFSFSSCTTTKQIAKEQRKTNYNQETTLITKENIKQSEKSNKQIKTGITDNTETIVIETHYTTPDSISGKQYKVSEKLTVKSNNIKAQIDVINTEIEEKFTQIRDQEVIKTDIKSTINSKDEKNAQKNTPLQLGSYLTVAVIFMLIFVLYRVLK